MSFCEFCGAKTPDTLEVTRFGEAKAKQRNDNWWVCSKCKFRYSTDFSLPSTLFIEIIKMFETE